MIIIEALKSGKKFRRHGEPAWLAPNEGRFFNVDSILATDWELEPTKIELDLETLKAAANKYLINKSSGPHARSPISATPEFKWFVEELGFEEPW